MSSESIERVDGAELSEPRGEVAALVAIQDALADSPGVLPAARGLSHVGEHAFGWLAISAVGWGLAVRRGDSAAERRWVEAGVGAFGAHAASVVIKRIVRRKRPHDPRIVVGVSTPSRLSFPSSHATSTTAAAILIGRAAGLPRWLLPAALVPPMLTSRLVLGVHYPSDVAAGAVIGALSAGAITAGDALIERAANGAAAHPRSTRAAAFAVRASALALLPGQTARAAVPAVARQLRAGRVSRNRENA
ncbi:phosphatase PAP2 family protein [Gordonia sp. ABSL49_1]|uniref:phosphatase PAP2 family protein n=1 Tax=Gordonia sp. ABSL49_1 TaxID=2920941 RepID=UPI001F0F8282|nr:phosphatase PAP2 family protein [Gordonia sp. ABSL49_1]MCH5643366.1 phosphatase PAP2 family protein [Gordonia sp. ABSL49_1]